MISGMTNVVHEQKMTANLWDQIHINPLQEEKMKFYMKKEEPKNKELSE